jgi:hypothetical protein
MNAATANASSDTSQKQLREQRAYQLTAKSSSSDNAIQSCLGQLPHSRTPNGVVVDTICSLCMFGDAPARLCDRVLEEAFTSSFRLFFFFLKCCEAHLGS